MVGLARHALSAAALAAALSATAAPAFAAPAGVERVEVQSGNLVYWSDDAPQEDWVTVTAGGAAGQVVLSETRTPSGGPGPGCVSISGQNAVTCSGVTSLELRALDLADRVTVEVALPATVDAGAGDDLVTGGPGDDILVGGLGADTVDGRGGYDVISSGLGNDTVEARDGAAELVDCGDGTDVVHADPADSIYNCETIDHTAVLVEDPLVQPPVEPVVAPVDPTVDPATGPDDTGERTAGPVAGDEPRIRSAPGADVDGDGVVDDRDGDGFADPGQGVAPVFDFAVAPGLTGPFRLVSNTIGVSRAGVATFEVACASTEPAPCRGSLFVDPAGKKSSAARARAVMSRRGRFGRSPFVVAAGKRKKLEVKLSRAACKRLGLTSGSRKARASRRGRKLRAKVTIQQKGKRAQTTVVTLRG